MIYRPFFFNRLDRIVLPAYILTVLQTDCVIDYDLFSHVLS